MRVFKNDEWEQMAIQGGIPHFGYYHSYWMPDGTVNPKFREDAISGLILDVKDKKEKGLNFFFSMLNQEIEEGVAICVVPSHDAAMSNNSGIAILARRLASEGRTDKVDFLLRRKPIDKLATGGQREPSVHLNSIIPNPDMTISGEVVLLVDDVTTSGASLRACQEILLENGAERVAMFALGQSIRE